MGTYAEDNGLVTEVGDDAEAISLGEPVLDVFGNHDSLQPKAKHENRSRAKPSRPFPSGYELAKGAKIPNQTGAQVHNSWLNIVSYKHLLIALIFGWREKFCYKFLDAIDHSQNHWGSRSFAILVRGLSAFHTYFGNVVRESVRLHDEPR